MGIQRYDINNCGDRNCDPLMTSDDGVYVEYGDVQGLIAENDQLKHEIRLLTEHNEFLASSDSRLAPELRAVKDALGLDFTASVIGEVVPAIEKLREGGLELLKAAYWLGWDCSNEVQNGEHLANARDLAWWVERRDKEIADLTSKEGKL